MHALLCSTGTMLGRPNGRDFRLLKEFENDLCCDGLELIFYDTWYHQADDLLSVIRSLSLPVPVFHIEKNICRFLVSDDKEEIDHAFDLFRFNCSLAARISAKKTVFHLWDGRMNDAAVQKAISFLPALLEESAKHNLLMTVENIVSARNDPFFYLRKAKALCPEVTFTYDTKMTAFHHLDHLFFSPDTADLLSSIRHFHINDYSGGYKEWERLKTLHPGEGQVDFERLFSHLPALRYTGDFTTEATSFDATGAVDLRKLNGTLQKIRQYIRKGT